MDIKVGTQVKTFHNGSNLVKTVGEIFKGSDGTMYRVYYQPNKNHTEHTDLINKLDITHVKVDGKWVNYKEE